MKRILHLCWGLSPSNGAANIARLIADEQRAAGDRAELKSWLSVREIRAADEVWCHCGWYYGIWWAVLWARLFGRTVRWLPEGCYDPVRRAYHGWKKRLAGPFEHLALRLADEVVATCAAEADWIRAYQPGVRRVSVTDIRRFFPVDAAGCAARRTAARERARQGGAVRLLYLGRAHPLKGTEYLVAAVAALNAARPGAFELKTAQTAQGEEKEALWRWADALVLPTLSDNFGLVVAEALARGVPVVTTDGAPSWLDLAPPLGVCVRGYRAADPATCADLLRAALEAAFGLVV